ncbi:amino acid adenylation domain-containing protein [Paenibacillus sp. QZ-Y1]|uniref:amino acid adenylation domain-containing protein n=1 Tax=Paenibacillus sp. QZ-Y1 TaxID=3414511 RepID=UPI003F79605E
MIQGNRKEQKMLKEVHWEATQIPVFTSESHTPGVFKSCRGDLEFVVITRLQAAANQLYTEPSSVLLAAWGILLSAYNHVDEVLFGTSLNGNILPIAVTVNSEHRVADLIIHTNTAYLAALESIGSQEGERSVEEHWSTRFDHVVIFDDEVVSDHYDFVFRMNEHSGQLMMIFKKARFQAEFITRMMHHFIAIVEQISEQQEICLGEIELVTEEEKKQLLEEFNRTDQSYFREDTLQQQFERRASEHPGRKALVFEDTELTYKELNERANQFAHYLRSCGVGRETFVGILADRSVAMVIGVFGVLKAGGAYVPLDPSYPEERIAYMLEDSGSAYMLVQQGLKPPVAYRGRVIPLDEGEWKEEERSNPVQVNGAEDLAYMIYTSGSTGQPKGVMIEHRGVSNFCLIAPTYGIVPESHVLQFSSFSFDSSVGEIFPTLLNGATLYMARKELLLSGAGFTAWLKANQIASVVFPPSVLRALPYEELPDLTTIITAGEACSPDLVRMWGRGRTFLNAYGPTEATVGSTVGVCTEEMEKPPIGRPIANKKIYIVNGQGKLQPIRVPGELCIGGDGLARGYWGKEELTLEKFVPNPYAQGERMYRTGDLACWLPDGTIEYIGRIDDQVKIRGHRIEPGEVARVLLEHGAVSESTVVAYTDGEGRSILCAYVVPRREWTAHELREHIRSRLPDYMVPSSFMEVKQIPLTPNGKVDKKALPEPDMGRQVEADYVAPTNEVERALAEIWQQVLQVEQVGIHDRFIELGGDSLKASMLLTRLQQEFGVEISFRVLFELPTVEAMALHIGCLNYTVPTLLKAVGEQPHYPASSMQTRLYAIEQTQNVGAAYHLPAATEITGQLDKETLQKAINALLMRHESLHTSFHFIDGQLVQKVHDLTELPLICWDAEDEKEADRLIQLFIAPFDLGEAPLFRVGLIRLLNTPNELMERHILITDMHHIIGDGTTQHILNEELSLLYQGKHLSLPAVQYKDYAIWESKSRGQKRWRNQEEYWLGQLDRELTVLELATDYPRPSIQQFKGDKLLFKISPDLTVRLKQLASEEGATLYMLLLACYQIMLSRYTGQEDIIVGAPVMRRPRIEFESVCGMFVNTLVMRGRTSKELSFTQFLQDVKTSVLDGYEHGDFPLEEIIGRLGYHRNPDRNPIFDTMFAMQNFDLFTIELPNLDTSPYPISWTASLFDMTWEALDGEALQFTVEYNTVLYKKTTIERMCRHFEHVLKQISGQQEICLGEIELVTEEEKKQLLEEFNRTDQSYFREDTLQQQFERRASEHPGRKALVFEDTELTYKELNERANQFAHYLRSCGVGRETFVGILADRSVAMVIGVFGVLKAGGAYVPLDPSYPEERIAYMLEDSGSAYMLVQQGLKPPVAYRGRVIPLDEGEWKEEERSNPVQVNGAEDLAYMIYTSGSTGQPKGVMIEHRGVSNFCLIAPTYGIVPESHVLQFSSFSFDSSVGEIFPTLLNGATLYMARKELLLSGAGFTAWLKANQIASVVFPPSVLRALPYEELPDLTTIITAGEACSPDLVRMWGRGRTFLNAYGPTEATVGSTVGVCTEEMEKPPIGRPIANKKIYIVNGQGKLQPIRVPGELCIGGDGLARGYWGKEELTLEKFVPNPYAQGERMYRTGDLACWLPDGTIEYIGRIDDQVKIRGHRIEPGEVARVLLEHGAVSESTVVAYTDGEGRSILCAYVVPRREWTAHELREHIRSRLPDYMVPSSFMEVKQIPLTPNGKVDKKALPEPDMGRQVEADYVAPTNEVERALAEIWQQVLQVEQVGIHDRFIELGGDSIKAIQVSARVHQRQLRMEVSDLLRYSTIAELAPHLKADATQIEQGVVEGEVPFLPIQHWFLEQQIPDAHHWNQAMMLFRSEGWLFEAVREVFAALLIHHDALRMAFLQDGQSIVQVVRGVGVECPVYKYDYRSSTRFLEEIETEANRLQRSIDLENGPLVIPAIFQTSQGDYLLIIVHHLIIDGVSWRVLLEDLENGYRQALRCEPIRFPLKTMSYQAWSRELQDYANSKAMRKEALYWNEVDCQAVNPLPVDLKPMLPYMRRDALEANMTLTHEHTELLLTETNRPYRSEPVHLLLAALMLAIREWSGEERIAVSLEGHGRESIIDGSNLGRTLGWFTSIFPAVFYLQSSELGEAVKSIKEMMRGIPNKGVGYGILKYLTAAQHKEAMSFKLKPSISFNYLGVFDQEGGHGFGSSSVPLGELFSPSTPINYVLEVNCIVLAGQLHLSIGYCRHSYDSSKIETILNRYQAYLISIISHCMAQKEQEHTLSDFSATKLTTEGLDDILLELNNLT